MKKSSRKTKRKGTVAVKVIAPKFENGGGPGDRLMASPVQKYPYPTFSQPSTPEDWGKYIHEQEMYFGNPRTWSMEDYILAQERLNQYKYWRENTPKGRAVIDRKSSPNEYVIPLPIQLDEELNAQIDRAIQENPELQFIPRQKFQVDPSQPNPLQQFLTGDVNSYANGGISFDFDDTLSTDLGLDLAKSIPSSDKYIISARPQVTPDMIQRAEQAGIPKNRIFAMGSDEAKVAKIQELGINRHIDNKQSVIDRLGFKGQLFENGGITKLTSEEEKQFQNFYKSLPENLQTDDATYDIRGYWDSEGRPSAFDYSQPKEKDGYYHAYSINSNTGEYLKSPAHETFQHAVDEDRKIGYRPIPNVYGRNIATYNPSIIEPTPTTFLTNTEGPIAYRYGGMYNPYQNLFANGGEQDEPPGRFFNWVKNFGRPKDEWRGFPYPYPGRVTIGSESSPRVLPEVVVEPSFWQKMKGAYGKVENWFENLNKPNREWYEASSEMPSTTEQQDPNFWKWINKERDLKSKKATSKNQKQDNKVASTSMSQGLFDMTFNNVDNMSSEQLENIGRSMGPTLEGTKYLEMAAIQKQNEEINKQNQRNKALSEGSLVRVGGAGVTPTFEPGIEYTPIPTMPLPYSGLTGGPLITRQEQNARDFFNYLRDNKEVAQQVLGRELSEEELFNESGNYDNYAQSDLFLNSGNSEFINKVEEQKYQNFLAENEKAADEAGVVYNTLDFARSLVTDFPTTAYNLFQGKMPLYQQSRGLRGESLEYEDYFKKYADTGSPFIQALNETQALVNPLSNVQGATISYGQGDYGSAALQGLAALPVLGLLGKATGIGAKAIGLGENLGTKAVEILGTEVLPNSKYLPGLTYGNVLEADMLYNTIKPEGYAQQAYEGFSEGDISKGIENVVYGALGVLPFGVGAASGIAGATSKIAQSQAASATRLLNQSAIDDVSRSLGLVDDAGNPISLNTITDESNFMGRLNTLKAYQEKGLIAPGTNLDIVAESPNLYETVTKAAIKRATTVERSVNADAIASGVAESSRGTVTNLDAQDLAAIQELGLTAPEDIAFYAGTTIPYGKYGDVVGLQGIDRNLRGLYHYRQGQNKFGDVDLQYGPYTVQSRYPLDLETGTARTWLERYGELPIKEFKSGYADKSLGYGDIFSQGTEAAVIGKSGETVLKPIKVKYASDYTANMKKIKEESSFTNTIYGSYKSGNTQAGETLVEMANSAGATNITNADDAHKFLSDLYFNRGLELQRNPGVKTKYFETFGEKAPFSPRTQKTSGTETLDTSNLTNIPSSNLTEETTKTIRGVLDTISKPVKEVKRIINSYSHIKDTPKLYKDEISKLFTPEGISRLKELGVDDIDDFMNHMDKAVATSSRFKTTHATLKGRKNKVPTINMNYKEIEKVLKSGKLGSKGSSITEEEIRSIMAHEIGHNIQNYLLLKGKASVFSYPRSKLDAKIVNELEPFFRQNVKDYLKNSIGLSEKEALELRKAMVSENRELPNVDYFLRGSEGLEPLAHLRELKQDMVNKGIINNIHDEITIQDIHNFYTYHGGFSDRVLSFIKPSEEAFKTVAKLLNKTPGLVPYVIGAGAAGAAGSQMSDDNKKMYGGTQRNKYIGLFR